MAHSTSRRASPRLARHLRRARGTNSPASVPANVGNGPADGCGVPSRFSRRNPITPTSGATSARATAPSTSSRNPSGTVTSGFSSSTHGPPVRRHPRLTAAANPRLRSKWRTDTPRRRATRAASRCPGDPLSTTWMVAAPVRTAADRRSWRTSRAVFFHWQ